MLDNNFVNTASVAGIYNSVSTGFTSTPVTTQVVDGLTITLSHDKSVWVEGQLTCSITIVNDASYPYENPEITDVLDTSIVSLVENSVQRDGVDSPYLYDAGSGTLKVTVPTIEVGGSTVVTFRIYKN